MKKLIENIKKFKNTKYGGPVLFFGFYFIFFLVIILVIVFYGKKDYLLKEYEKGVPSYKNVKVYSGNYRFDYKINLDGNYYNYYGKKNMDVESFKYNNADYYRAGNDFFTNNGTWIKCDNPYVFSELIEFKNVNNILKNASFVEKISDNKKNTYKYLISSNTINKIIYKKDTDFEEMPNEINVELDGDKVSRIDMKMNSLCINNGSCQNSLELDLNYELYNSVSKIDNPIE